MMLAEFCYVAPVFFYSNNSKHFDDVMFCYIWTRIKDFMKGGLLGSANVKIMHHRGNLEIWDLQMS